MLNLIKKKKVRQRTGMMEEPEREETTTERATSEMSNATSTAVFPTLSKINKTQQKHQKRTQRSKHFDPQTVLFVLLETPTNASFRLEIDSYCVRAVYSVVEIVHCRQPLRQKQTVVFDRLALLQQAICQ